MKKIWGVIFDFNGVLWWDSHIVERSWRDYVSTKYNRQLDHDTIQNRIHGRSCRETLESFEGRKLVGKELQLLIEEKESHYKKLCLEEGESFKLSPGSETLLEYLKSNNIPYTIATSSDLGNTTFFFKHLNLDRWFDFEKVVYDDGIISGKPAPDLYIKAANSLKLSPEECMVIEDARSGIQAAVSANVGMIIALGPKNTHGDLVQIKGVTKAIERVDEIIAMIASV